MGSLLIIHHGALGDFVAIFPALTRLRANFDGIDVMCQSRLGRLAQKLGMVNHYFPLEAAGAATLYTDNPDRKIIERLNQYSKIVLFSNSKKLEATINRLAATPCHRIRPKPPVDQPIHILDHTIQHLVLNKILATKNSDNIFSPRQVATKASPKVNPRSQTVLIHPGAGSKRKRWPLNNFIELETQLKSDGLHPEFLLGPAENDLSALLAVEGRKIHALSDPLDMVDLLQSAGGYIGNDSGASHVAAFLGLPSVVIFTASDPARWKPTGPLVEIVHTTGLECRPCFETKDQNCPDPKCVSTITLASVLKAFYKGDYFKPYIHRRGEILD